MAGAVLSPFLFAVYIECLRESGFAIMTFILAVYSVDVYYMVTTLYFFVLAVIVSGSYWIFVGTMVLNGTQSSLQARVLLVFLVGGSQQLEMFYFSYKSYSGQHGLNIFDVSLNVILVRLTHSLLFVNFMVQLTIYCVRLAERETKWWLFI